jgi:hypothetical protein
MRPTINLDDEVFLPADKIDDVRSNRFLTHEFEASQAPVAQCEPKFHLGFRALSA